MGVSNNIEIREAVAADDADYASFLRRAWQEAGPASPGFSGATDEAIDELSASGALLDRIGSPDGRIVLAWDGDDVVGFAATRGSSPTEVELAGIVVLASIAGRGVGSRLLAAAAEQASRDGYVDMIVQTEAANALARAFYERQRFAVINETTIDINGVTVDIVELHRSLEVQPGR